MGGLGEQQDFGRGVWHSPVPEPGVRGEYEAGERALPQHGRVCGDCVASELGYNLAWLAPHVVRVADSCDGDFH